MEQDEPQKVYLSCPECGQQYRWKSHYAGHRVRCANCRAKLRYPLDKTAPMEVLEPASNPDAVAGSSESAGAGSQHEGAGSAAGSTKDADAAGGGDTYALAEDPDAVDQAQQAETRAREREQGSPAPSPSSSPKGAGQSKDTKTPSASPGATSAKKPGADKKSAASPKVEQDKPQSLVEQQRFAEQPADVSEYRASQMREAARKAQAQAAHEEEKRKLGLVYPMIALAVAGVAQLLANVINLSAVGALGPAVGAILALIAQVILYGPLAAVLLAAAGVLGMTIGELRSAATRFFAVAFMPFAVANLIAASTGLTDPAARSRASR